MPAIEPVEVVVQPIAEVNLKYPEITCKSLPNYPIFSKKGISALKSGEATVKPVFMCKLCVSSCSP